MTSRRAIVAMTADEVRAYLALRTRIIVTTNGPLGFPHAVPMEYGLDEEGRILITSFTKSQKIRNLQRDPRATLLVESGQTYGELKGVMIYANAELLDDIQDVARLLKLISVDQAMTASITQSMDEQVRASLAKRIVVRFAPVRYVTWDHGKLGGLY